MGTFNLHAWSMVTSWMEIEMTKITTKAVNKALVANGINAEIVRGEGYWYFSGEGTGTWKSTSVYTMRLNDLSVHEWVEQAKAFCDEKDC